MHTAVFVDEDSTGTSTSHVVTVEAGHLGCPLARTSTHARAEIVKAAFDRWAESDPAGLESAMRHAN